MRIFTFSLMLALAVIFGASIADDSDPISGHGVQDHPDPVGWGFTPADEDPR